MSQSAIWTLGPISVSFEFCVSMAYWLGAFTFVALFPYMLNIISLLKPENIINRLTSDITKDKILKYIKLAKTSVGVEISTVDDPILPIMDIIHGSIMKYDLGTTRVGLNAVTYHVIEIIDSDGEGELSEYFCDHLQRTSGLAASRADEKSTVEAITNLGIFGRSTVVKELKVATWQAALFIGVIGKATAEKGLNTATVGAVLSLEFIGKAAAKKGLENATKQAAKYLAELTILGEEIVKSAQYYKSKFEEKDHVSFQKFWEIYREELGELEKKRA